MGEIDQHWQVKSESVLGQQKNGDCLTKGREIPELPKVVHVKFPKNKVSELADIWGHLDPGQKEKFQMKFGDIALLVQVEVNETLLRAAIQFWDPCYRCFTFNHQDLTPMIEEYSAMLRVKPTSPFKIYWRDQKRGSNIVKFFQMMGKDKNNIEEGQVRENGIPWGLIKCYLINNPKDERGLDLLALAIYGLVIFPKISGFIDPVIVGFVEQIGWKINPIPAILAETFRTLDRCRNGGGRKNGVQFTGCAPMLFIWIQSHIWGKFHSTKLNSPAQLHSSHFIPIREFLSKEWPKDITKEQWVAFFNHLEEEDVTWRSPWVYPQSILYACGNEQWVPLIEIWGATSYAPLLVQRQLDSQMFVPQTFGLDIATFEYGTEGSNQKI